MRFLGFWMAPAMLALLALPSISLASPGGGNRLFVFGYWDGTFGDTVPHNLAVVQNLTQADLSKVCGALFWGGWLRGRWEPNVSCLLRPAPTGLAARPRRSMPVTRVRHPSAEIVVSPPIYGFRLSSLIALRELCSGTTPL